MNARVAAAAMTDSRWMLQVDLAHRRFDIIKQQGQEMAAARIVRTALASSLQSSRQLSNGVRVAAAPASIVASWRATAAFSTSSASRQAACPSCGAALSSASAVPSVTCSSCDAIVPPPSDTSYFALLGDQTPSFRPDMASVKRAFLTLQQKVHPDRVGGGRDKEESAARAWSAVVNEAYKTLGDNLRRAEYLVRRSKNIHQRACR